MSKRRDCDPTKQPTLRGQAMLNSRMLNRLSEQNLTLRQRRDEVPA